MSLYNHIISIIYIYNIHQYGFIVNLGYELFSYRMLTFGNARHRKKQKTKLPRSLRIEEQSAIGLPGGGLLRTKWMRSIVMSTPD